MAVRISLEALAEAIAQTLQEPTYCLDELPDGFVRFDPGPADADETEAGVKATIVVVSDGESAIAGPVGEVVEIIVRRVGA